VRGADGEIRLFLDGDRGIEVFKDIPNFLSVQIDDEISGGVSYRLQGHSGTTYHVTVNVAGSRERGDQSIWMCLDAACQEVSVHRSKYEFEAINPKSLYMKSNARVASVTLKSLEWEVNSNRLRHSFGLTRARLDHPKD
jgi:hypothetical protein